MPLIRRLPKVGFRYPFRTEYAVVNLKSLVALGPVEQITPQVLAEAGLVKRKAQLVKILGVGDLGRPVTIQAHKFSKSAKDKIQAAGGRAEVISGV
jgi:large subunit ribosomal protein L15